MYKICCFTWTFTHSTANLHKGIGWCLYSTMWCHYCVGGSAVLCCILAHLAVNTASLHVGAWLAHTGASSFYHVSFHHPCTCVCVYIYIYIYIYTMIWQIVVHVCWPWAEWKSLSCLYSNCMFSPGTIANENCLTCAFFEWRDYSL